MGPPRPKRAPRKGAGTRHPKTRRNAPKGLGTGAPKEPERDASKRGEMPQNGWADSSNWSGGDPRPQNAQKLPQNTGQKPSELAKDTPKRRETPQNSEPETPQTGWAETPQNERKRPKK